MTTEGNTTTNVRSGRLNTKQFKIWIDLIDSPDGYDISDLAEKHNYTNREVTTAIGRMPTPPIMFEDGYVWFKGTEEDREKYRRELTADRYCISEDMCQQVISAMTREWMSVTSISLTANMPAVVVSRTLVVIGNRIDRKSYSGGMFYRLQSSDDDEVAHV